MRASVIAVKSGALASALAWSGLCSAALAQAQPGIESRGKGTVTEAGLSFRDADGDGALDPYEDWRRATEERVADLLPRMSRVEKAGMLLIDTLNAGCEGGTEDTTARDYIQSQRMTRFILRNTVTGNPSACEGEPGRGGFDVSPARMAEFTNAVQQLAEAQPLGIPVIFKSNARNHYNTNPRFGISGGAGAMTEFPKEPGIAAAVIGTGGTAPVEKLTEVMGREWRALGIRGMYGYMADLATEPRWYRVDETFGENSEVTARIATAIVEGLQGPALGPESAVALTMKHFPGGGPQQGGRDPHYSFGKNQVYPGGAFADHVAPFRAAIEAGVASIMPYYGVPIDAAWEGEPFERLGMSFSREMIDGFLREDLGFGGYVNSDTGIILDRGWGLEDRAPAERFATAVNAGVDVLSGFHDVALVTGLLDTGSISEERLDEAVGRLLTEQFDLGLFEDPYVDPAAAAEIIGDAAHRAKGQEVQKESLVLLRNENGILPLAAGGRVYAIGMAPDALAEAGYQVTDGNPAADGARPTAADHDAAIIRVTVGNANTRDYRSQSPDYGADPDRLNPDTGKVWGAEDPCEMWPDQNPRCVDDVGLIFGGALPWEIDDISFSAMAEAASWEITPPLTTIREVLAEASPEKSVLVINFRAPYVLDSESGLRDAAGLIANFEVSDAALVAVLSGAFDPVGGLPFALASNLDAVIANDPDLPGYPEADTLYPFGFGLDYGR